jgi:hypothetical protein
MALLIIGAIIAAATILALRSSKSKYLLFFFVWKKPQLYLETTHNDK